MLNINLDNKWIRGAIPALFIHLCIGSVYCWSLLKNDIAYAMGINVSGIEFAFTLAIFFLGMSAAFCGNLVERNVRTSSFISMICFSLGLLLSVVSINNSSIIGLYLSYGALMGIGLGIGYLSPIKTLMLWFKDNKGLATGIAIMGFGLSKTIFSPFIEFFNAHYGVTTTLTIIAILSIIMMSIASHFIKKPNYWKEENKKISLSDTFGIITNKNYIMIWLIFFLNITCGLVIISFEKSMSLNYGIAALSIGFIAASSALLNALGRFGYASLSDKFNNKQKIYSIIFITCIFTGIFFVAYKSIITWIIFLMVINAGYGGGFSTLPNLLESIFGMKSISTIHGYTLSAWGFAAIAAFLITQVVIYNLNCSYDTIIEILILIYILSFIISLFISKK